MTICFFGMYAPRYSRNWVLLKGFRQNGVEIIKCNDRSHFLWGFRYWKLLRKFIEVKGWNCDVIFVGFPGQTDVPLAWILGKIFHKAIVFDAFISIYNSLVFDRKNFSEKSWKARLWWFVDWLSCFLADRVILDTNEHIKYFVKTFKIKQEKFIRVFVGTDTDVFRPRRSEMHRNFLVGFHGSYLPLQGIGIIIEAARSLQKRKDIKFSLLGDGIERKKIEEMIGKYHLTNVQLLDPILYEKLPGFISANDIYLGGPFGNNSKSKMVIPNKVYEAMAMGKPVIIGSSPATKELFSDQVHCLLVEQNNPKQLVRAVLALQRNKELRVKIASGGYNLVISQLTPRLLAEGLAYELDH